MPATIQGPGEGERYPAGPSTILIKAASEDTGGTLSLNETEVEAGFAGPPPHYHETFHDMFYVLAGTLTLIADGVEHVAVPGTFACVPPGTVHTFRNDSDAPVRFLNLQTPGGFERYMRDLGEAARDGGLTPEAIGRVVARHDVQLAG
jgi:quercetin dioxygenase-like cupin family protein